MRLIAHTISFLLASALASAPLAFSEQSASDPMQNLFRQGAHDMNAGNAAAAEGDFRQAIALDPSFAPAHLDLGLALLKQGKLLDAIASIRKSVELDPTSPGAHLFLGIAEYQSHHEEDAINDLHLALKEDPKNIQTLTWLGIVELNTGHPEKAVEPLDRAAELAPKDENVLDYRVQAHIGIAKQSYTELFTIDPASWRLHRLNAIIDSEAQDHKQAADEYQQAIKLAPKEPSLYEGLGWEQRALGHADLAAQAFAEQLRLTPGNPIAMYNLGSAQVDSGQERAAVPLLEQVVKIYGAPSAADYYLGRGLAAEGKDTEAIASFQRATNLTGELQRRAWYELSQAYRRTGKTAEARSAVLNYEQLRKAADGAGARQAEDYQKLNAAGHAEEPAAEAKPQP
jgi:tetratricopeptide (TPR) repeat protein